MQSLIFLIAKHIFNQIPKSIKNWHMQDSAYW